MTSMLQVAHTVLAVIAVGTNLSFPIWTRLAEREGASLVTAVSGMALGFVERVDPVAIWIAGSTVLFVVLMGLGFVLYRPVSRLRVAAAARGPADPAYRRSSRRADALDAAILGAALAILALMVLRPA